ncbi:MAG: excinuclease ABC subunit B [Candidatus Blackburnbacteria bacterium RIFCSPHIGHO2_01_FULL_43_15b]|uniref:UvrABC system protein B n=1 Tax=Candidatus Blackburnbacteria bacterium RIFCSPHIGHO2_01_FULL_43_15b TaxID=1797513 RepID=A0A1G1V145_9BACT|nr:MAG: excinuclease ABC subunit B [Candidatus Blackburnbacteria bacterium RIFCSPHIGHO2_01_FULL_43_15b]
MKFKLESPYQLTGDQPQALEQLIKGIKAGASDQVLLGVTGSGKTFTVANVIDRLQLPTLVISHNKTLAGQLYQELRDFFPENGVSYFVSYYDYYQPEAYIPQTDTYIEKETDINREIDKLRLRATTNLMTRRDVITVASVSCIYNIGSPQEYGNFALELEAGRSYARQDISKRLIDLQYERGDYGFHRGTWRVRGDAIDIFPAYEDTAVRLEFEQEKLQKLTIIDPLTGKTLSELKSTLVYPAKHYMMNREKRAGGFGQIRQDLQKVVKNFKDEGKLLEANRIERRVTYDLEMIEEVGYVNGIENYSRYFDGRKPGDAPYTLLDYYKHNYGDNFLVVIDESHMTIPQIGGMYNGDLARKHTLIDFGFRLPAAYDNRPLKFEEFLRRIPKVLYTSATPAQWELTRAGQNGVIQQLIRPTGIPDPEVIVKPTEAQIPDLMKEISERVGKGQRTLVTTLTKRMAEDLTSYLKEQGLKVQYLHSEVNTLDRTDILDQLRRGEYDVLIGINLLREGLDLPEVSLVAILDADKEGFLRSETALIQVMGRAARHIEGKVIMYADNVTGSMQRAIREVERRRVLQLDYNRKHNIIPKTIVKPIREKLVDREEIQEAEPLLYGIEREVVNSFENLSPDELTPRDRKNMTMKLRRAMTAAARDLNFELAAKFRDRVRELESI